MDVGSLTGVTERVEFSFAGQVGNVEYRPNVYSLGYYRKIRKVLDEEQIGELAPLLCELIAAWDLTANGEPIPVTPEGMERVPFPLINAIQAAIQKASDVPDDEKKGSSMPTASSAAPAESSNGDSSSSPSGPPTTDSLTSSAGQSTS